MNLSSDPCLLHVKRRNSPRFAFSALLLLTSSVGCQQRAATKLLGRWEGRPDTSAARAEREAEKYGRVAADLLADRSTADGAAEAISAEGGTAGKASQTKQVTDWENYDVAIQIDFVSSECVEMSLGNREPRSGSWKVVSTSPAGCAIEIQTESDGAADQPPTVERRRFELLLDERDGICVGFLLTEAGADRQQGALYFQRPQPAGVVE